MKQFGLLATTALAIVAVSASAHAQSRDFIRAVGSSTVFPYNTVIAETFTRITGNPSPVVESTGTGGGMQIFCGGIGIEHPDMTGASRPMTQSEYNRCVENGVTDISELLLGFDGIALAVSRDGTSFDISLADLFLALAADVEVDGQIVPNPYQRWSEIDPSYPDSVIQVLGPPPTSGTRDAWVELVMHAGCREWPAIEALRSTDADRYRAVCERMREDGRFIEAGEDDYLIVQRMINDQTAYGIFGYSYLYENQDTLQAVQIAGVEPTPESIGDFSYPVSRPIFIYIKNAHRDVIPGLDDYVDEATSDDASGPGGYLVDIGLVPAPAETRAATREAVMGRVHFSRYE